MRALRVVGIALAVLVAGAFAAGSYLLAREEVPAESSYQIDLARLRELAASLPGPLPVRLNHELVARAHLPRAAVFAGESFDPHPMIHGAYQIRYRNGFVVVDAALSPETFERDVARSEDDVYNALGWEVLTTALERADIIVVTHEHSDHLDGIASHPSPEKLAPRVRLNPEQLADPTIDGPLRREIQPLDYDGMLALAPGVVLLRAPGHTPGTQMVFVKLLDGQEWLLLGDVAWHMNQIRDLHYRPRLVTDLVLGEDRSAVLDQFRALHDLMQEHPEVQLVSSHDEEQRAQLVQSGRLGERFE